MDHIAPLSHRDNHLRRLFRELDVLEKKMLVSTLLIHRDLHFYYPNLSYSFVDITDNVMIWVTNDKHLYVAYLFNGCEKQYSIEIENPMSLFISYFSYNRIIVLVSTLKHVYEVVIQKDITYKKILSVEGPVYFANRCLYSHDLRNQYFKEYNIDSKKEVQYPFHLQVEIDHVLFHTTHNMILCFHKLGCLGLKNGTWYKIIIPSKVERWFITHNVIIGTYTFDSRYMTAYFSLRKNDNGYKLVREGLLFYGKKPDLIKNNIFLKRDFFNPHLIDVYKFKDIYRSRLAFLSCFII